MSGADMDGHRHRMSMIVPFARPASRRGWTAQDRADLERVRRTLAAAGLNVDTDEGVTDEGDPWFVVLRAGDEEVLVHIARIGAEYVVAGPALERPLRGRSLRGLVEDYARRQSLWFPFARDGAGKVFVHPASLVAALVATLVALSGEAFANEDPAAPSRDTTDAASSVSPVGAVRPGGEAPSPLGPAGDDRRSATRTGAALASLVAGFALLATSLDGGLGDGTAGREITARASEEPPRWLGPLPQAHDAGESGADGAPPLSTRAELPAPPSGVAVLAGSATGLPPQVTVELAPRPDAGPLAMFEEQAMVAAPSAAPETATVLVDWEARAAEATDVAGLGQVAASGAAASGGAADGAAGPGRGEAATGSGGPPTAERRALVDALTEAELSPEVALVTQVGEQRAHYVLLDDRNGGGRLAVATAEGDVTTPAVFLEAATAVAASGERNRPLYDAKAAAIVTAFAARVDQLAVLATRSEILLFDAANLDGTGSGALVARSWEMPDGILLSLLGGREDFPADLFIV